MILTGGVYSGERLAEQKTLETDVCPYCDTGARETLVVYLRRYRTLPSSEYEPLS